AEAEAGHGAALPLHLPLQGRSGGRQGEGEGALQAGMEPTAGSPAAPDQPGAQGMDYLLPLRGVERKLQLPPGVYLAPGSHMAATKAPQGQLEVAPSPLPSPVAADGRPG